MPARDALQDDTDETRGSSTKPLLHHVPAHGALQAAEHKKAQRLAMLTLPRSCPRTMNQT
jgi:hypothetical protein